MESIFNHHSLIFFVNGKKVTEENVDPEWTLLYYLRNKLGLCGTKLGCAEGGCGACTVMVSKYDSSKDRIEHLAVNACLAPVCSMHGLAITTVEGIGSTKTKLHPTQEKIAESHGSQCGFCTPGIVMSMYTLLRNSEKPSFENIRTAFQGNLCRCTGYRPIIEAYKTFANDTKPIQNGITNTVCGMGEKCCRMQSNGCSDSSDSDESKPVQVNNLQEPIFPPELKLTNIYNTQKLYFKGKNVIWFRPTNLQEVLLLKSTYPASKIIAGNTEIGVEIKFKQKLYPIFIQTTHVHELNNCTINDGGAVIGASVTLDCLESFLQNCIQLLPETETRIFKAVIDMLQLFAGKQIRNVASIGGNIVTSSPISDLNPILMAARAKLQVQHNKICKEIVMDNNFFTGYRTNKILPTDTLLTITIPFSNKDQYFYVYKQSRRKEDDIAIVNSAMDITIENNRVTDICLAFGGVGLTTVIAEHTCKKLLGMKWDNNLLEAAYTYLLQDLQIPGDAPGGMVEYRKTLPLSFFFKTYIQVSKSIGYLIDKRDVSAVNQIEESIPKSSQMYSVDLKNRNKVDTVGQPLAHVSSYKQATGEAVYFDDIPKQDNELYMAFIYSQKSHAKIISIDLSEALKSEGVIGHISADDIKYSNKLGPVHQDEELFITKTVTSQYQLLGAIVAMDQRTAKSAANKVVVKYEEISPVIVSIEDAIENNTFFPTERKLEIGDVDRAFKGAKHVLSGECRTGYQEHFYLETHGCLVYPKEDDGMEIFTSSQHHAEVSDFVSRILNVPQNRVITKIKRIGGGFGGKQSRGVPIAAAAAVAARKFQRPIRIMLDRDEDMAMTGGRHPYLVRYQVAFEGDGTILGYKAQVFSNGGYSNDLSIEVLERAVFHIENVYKIPNLRVIGRICRTNLPTNTAFRGFGAPQAMFAAENMIRDVSEFLKLDVIDVTLKNLYKEGDITHYNQRVLECNLRECLEECLKTSEYTKRKAEINMFNKENRWKKRGLSLVSTKYGVGFGVPFLEQAGALVNIYTDGSVLLTHSGVEMGQGLNTKMIQIASKVLEIPTTCIYINECATDKVPNTSPTAASVGSDLNGMAVKRACTILKERIQVIIDSNPEGSWKDWIKDAYFKRVPLSATGYFSTPDICYDWETNTGKPYNYYTYGAACTEVEIDCLSGDHRILRTDIVMDLGKSLNPAIDIGQIEGAFLQGYGLFVMEELVISPTGTIYSKGPGAYKIPGFNDIPIEFNVSLLQNTANSNAIYSSKAVGEPPLFLASSALFAIREAVKAARRDSKQPESFRLNAPATADKIRMACEDNLTIKVKKTTLACKKPWNVIP